MKTTPDLTKLLDSFTHKISIKVQFHQVDSFQILHNIQYLYIFENARLEFLQSYGLANNLSDLINKFPVMTVHHEIDYYAPAHFNDTIEVFTKIKEIGNSSILFENLAVSNNQLLARATTVYVYVNPITGESQNIPIEVRDLLN